MVNNHICFLFSERALHMVNKSVLYFICVLYIVTFQFSGR